MVLALSTTGWLIVIVLVILVLGFLGGGAFWRRP